MIGTSTLKELTLSFIMLKYVLLFFSIINEKCILFVLFLKSDFFIVVKNFKKKLIFTRKKKKKKKKICPKS